MLSLRFLAMTLFFHLLFNEIATCQRFDYPNGVINYLYETNNKSLNQQYNHRNRCMIQLEPEILGVNFNIMGSYSMFKDPFKKTSVFTFSLNFDPDKFQRNLNRSNILISESSRRQSEINDSIAEFNRLRYIVSNLNTGGEIQKLNGELKMVDDSLKNGFVIDSMNRHNVSSQIAANDSLTDRFRYYFERYRTNFSTGPVPDSVSLGDQEKYKDSILNEKKHSTSVKFLSNINRFSIGYHSVSNSEISIFNFPMNGISWEYFAKPFFIQGSIGKKKEFYPDMQLSPVLRTTYNNTKVKYLQVGLGEKRKTHWYLKCIHFETNEKLHGYNYENSTIMGSEMQYVTNSAFKINLELNGLLIGKSRVENQSNDRTDIPLAQKVHISQNLFNSKSTINLTLVNSDKGYNNPGSTNLIGSTTSMEASINSSIFKNKLLHVFQFKKSSVSLPIKTEMNFYSNFLNYHLSSNTFVFSTITYFKSSHSIPENAPYYFISSSFNSGIQNHSKNKNGKLVTSRFSYNFINVNAQSMVHIVHASAMIEMNKRFDFGLDLSGGRTQVDQFTYSNMDGAIHGKYRIGKALYTENRLRLFFQDRGMLKADLTQRVSYELRKRSLTVFVMANEIFPYVNERLYASPDIYISTGLNLKF